MTEPDDSARQLLRHCLATLAYRCRKVVAETPEGFATFAAGQGTRTPVAILAHVADLVDWAGWLAKGQKGGKNSTPGSWESEVARVYDNLAALDRLLASSDPLAVPAERLFQGPLADAFTHVGQIALLRRLAGAPVRGENYFRAEITMGRVGWDQAPARFEFD